MFFISFSTPEKERHNKASWADATAASSNPTIDCNDLLGNALAAADALIKNAPVYEEPWDCSGIIGEEAELRAWVLAKEPSFLDRDPMIRLSVAALTLSALHLSEMTLREQAQLLWIFEGRSRMRAHDGACYMYRRGAWHLYDGLVSDVTLARMKRWVSAAAGCFARLPTSTERSRDAVFNALVCLRNAQPELDDRDWVDYLVVSRPERDSGAGKGLSREVGSSWNVAMASNLSKCGTSLQSELLGQRLMP